MQLCYFDENKHSDQSPDFFIGGIIIPDTKATSLEQTLSRLSLNYFGSSSLTKSCEFHGKEIFHGKGASKGKKMENRIQVFRDFARLIIDNQIPIRIARIDVRLHLAKYKYPMETYKLGLMLTLERFAQYLKSTKELGMVFGDYEADEISRAVVDFSEYKKAGKNALAIRPRPRNDYRHRLFYSLTSQPLSSAHRPDYFHGRAIRTTRRSTTKMP